VNRKYAISVITKYNPNEYLNNRKVMDAFTHDRNDSILKNLLLLFGSFHPNENSRDTYTMSGQHSRALVFALTLLFLSSVISGATMIQSLGRSPEGSDASQRDNFPPSVLSGSQGFFTENVGQIGNSDVKYSFSSTSFSLGFVSSGYILNLHDSIEDRERAAGETGNEREGGAESDAGGSIIRVDFLNSNPVLPVGSEELQHTSTYIYGDDPEEWRWDVPNYGTLVYQDIYDGIDLVFYGTAGGLKYDFEISPGADPSQVRYSYDGADDLRLDDNGNLHIISGGIEHIEQAPYSYQETQGEGSDGERIEIASGYQIAQAGSLDSAAWIVSFDVGKYDAVLPLTIDPLIYSTYLGAEGSDGGFALAQDPDGNTYVAGYTTSNDFPNTTGAYDTSHNGKRDVFVLKLNSDGTDLIYSTYVGGSANEGSDYLADALDLLLDENGNVYVAGPTESDDFPTTPLVYREKYGGGQYDLFLFKLNSEGSDLVFSTFLGGNSADFREGVSLAFDPHQNLIITGQTLSEDYPTTDYAYDKEYNGNGDAVLSILKGDGSDLIYSTFLGGAESDSAHGIFIDNDDLIYLTGSTGSEDFPIIQGSYDEDITGETDVFVTKLNADGTDLIYSTFVGGEGEERGFDIAVDDLGIAYVAGETTSTDFPTADGSFDEEYNGGGSDAFFIALNKGGSDLIFSTYIGGQKADTALLLAIGSGENSSAIVIAGTTWSSDFPTTSECLDHEHGDQYSEVFISRFSSDGSSLHYSSFYGGTVGNEDAGDLLLDPDNNVLLTGRTGSSDFRISPESYDESYNGDFDAFLVTVNFLTANITSISPAPALQTDTVEFRGKGLNGGNIQEYHWFSNLDGELYLGANESFTTSNLSVGEHSITLRVHDDTGSGYWSDNVSSTLTIHERPVANIDSILPSPALETDTISFDGSGTDDGSIVQYSWRSSVDGELYSDTTADFTIGASALSNGTHSIYLKVQDNFGVWSSEDSVQLHVNGVPRARIEKIDPNPATEGTQVTFQGNATDDGDIEEYSWKSDLDGSLGNQAEFNTSFLSNGTHTISFKVKDDLGAWSEEVTSILQINGIPRAIIENITPEFALEGEMISFQGKGSDDGIIVDYLWISSKDGDLSNQSSFNLSTLSIGGHTISFLVMDDGGIWSLPVLASVSVNGIPVAEILEIKPLQSTEGDVVRFSGSGTDDGTLVGFYWNSSMDGFLSENKTFSLSNLTNGTHIISFRVRDDHDVWSDEVSQEIHVNGIPVAIILEIDPMDSLWSEVVTFNGSGSDDGTIVNYSWISSLDLFISREKTFEVSNLSNGTHTITFRVQDNYGVWSRNVSRIIRVNGKPVARIESIDPLVSIQGSNVSFRGNGTDDGHLVGFRWDSMEDGFLSNEPSFVMAHLTNGTHTIRFKVQDNLGVWSEIVTLNISVNGIPVAEIIDINPTLSNQGEVVSFHGYAVDDNSVLEYQWFSTRDAFLSNELSFIRSNLSNGSHTISFRVMDDDGVWSDEASRDITVNGIPVAVIDLIEPQETMEEDIITFIGYGTDDGSIMGYLWMSDIQGPLSNTSTFSTRSLIPGLHTISFFVTDEHDAPSTLATEVVTVHPLPPHTLSVTAVPNVLYPDESLTIITNYSGHEMEIIIEITDEDGAVLFADSGPIGENGISLFHYSVPPSPFPGNYTVNASTENVSALAYFTILEPIFNLIPEIHGIPHIIPLPPSTEALSSSNLSAVVNATDPNKGDILTYAYNWFVNGNPVGMNSPILRWSNFGKGDIVHFSVFVSDGFLTTADHFSDSIVIGNTPPGILNPTISPIDPLTTHDLTAHYDYYDFDGDSEGQSLIQWQVNNDDGLGWLNDHIGPVLFSENTEKDQRWRFMITPSDSEGQEESAKDSEEDSTEGPGVVPETAYISESVVIGNTKPLAIISNPSAERALYEGTEIFFDARGSFDPDDDHLTYQWRIDGDQFNASHFWRLMDIGDHTIELKVDDGSDSTSRKLILTVNERLKPDLFTLPSESYLSNLEPDGTGRVGKDISFTVFIWNKGDIEATATVNFYVGDMKGAPIGQKEVRVPVGGFDTAFVTWNPDQDGFVTLYASIVRSNPAESDESNNLGHKNVTVVRKAIPDEESSNGAIVVILGVVSMGMVGAVVSGYEPWKYRFFAFLIPLYTKMNHDNRMDNENRSKILGFIMGVEEGKRESTGLPGVSYSTIKKKLNFSNGALAYHLSVLEREGDIRSEKVGKFRLYFPKKVVKPKTMFLERLTDLQQRLVDEMKKHTEISQKRLVRSMKESQQVISYNLNRLEQKGIVFLKKRGNRSYCKLNPEYYSNQ